VVTRRLSIPSTHDSERKNLMNKYPGVGLVKGSKSPLQVPGERRVSFALLTVCIFRPAFLFFAISVVLGAPEAIKGRELKYHFLFGKKVRSKVVSSIRPLCQTFYGKDWLVKMMAI